MKEEIFGPILPILPYQKPAEAVAFLKQCPEPSWRFLSLQPKPSERSLRSEPSFLWRRMHQRYHPAPGKSISGLWRCRQQWNGSYHGKVGFDTFKSHQKHFEKIQPLRSPLPISALRQAEASSIKENPLGEKESQL